jgi:hypothetical protein
MPGLDPAPGAEYIDEDAARRSIRVTSIGMAAAILFFGLAGVLIFTRVDHPPSGVHHGVAWTVEFFMAFVGILLTAVVLRVYLLYRRPIALRVMQYGWRRRRRVGKDLRRGRPLSAEDLPVASALVDLARAERQRLALFFGLMVASLMFDGLSQHGTLRWIAFGWAAYGPMYLPFLLRQQRQMMRGYERQRNHTADEHQDAASATS